MVDRSAGLFSGAFAYFIESTLILNGCLFFSSNCYIISKSAGSIAITLFALWMVDRSASLFSGAFAFIVSTLILSGCLFFRAIVISFRRVQGPILSLIGKNG